MDLQALQNQLAVLEARKALVIAQAKMSEDSLTAQIAAVQAKIKELSNG